MTTLRKEAPVHLPPASGLSVESVQLKPVLTPKMLAEFWMCSERHVRKLIQRGQLPVVRIGEKLIRIRAEDVIEFMARSAAAVDRASDSSAENSGSHRQVRAARLDRVRRRA